MTNYIYPVYIDKQPDESGYHFVEIPAIDGFTQGSSIANAIEMAEDYIGHYLIETPTPAPSITAISPTTGDQTAILVIVDKERFTPKLNNQSIKKY